MTYQAINLGTPNNNDGDSLYAGGTKINGNFTEIYTALAGSTANAIRIELTDAGLVTGNSLRYSSMLGKFVSVSSTSLRTLGNDGASLLYLTNNAGLAGVDEDLTAAPNSLNSVINGRRMFQLRARTTSTTALTRGELHIGLGLNNVTSLSVLTTSVVVRGVNGLEIFISAAEDSASYTKMLDTSSNGVRLYNSPVLDVASGATKAISDSSNSIAHTGFVKAWTERYASSSFTITVNNGIIGGGNLSSATRNIGIDPVFYPHLCQGFLYSYNSVANQIAVTPGAATHYSFGTAGEVPISNTSVLSIVASSSTNTKTWATGWSVGGSNAILDASITADTWYYIYLIAETATGAPDIVLSSQRTIGLAQSALNGVTVDYSIIRRLGCVRTDSSGSPVPLPFTVSKVADSTIHFSWARLRTTGAINPGTAAHSAFRRQIITTAQITPRNTSTAATATAENFFSSNLTFVPSIPGVTAKLGVVYQPAFTTQNPVLYLYGYGMHHSSITTNVQGAPMEVISRPQVSLLTSNTTIMLPMSPDREQMTETNLGTASIFPTTGQTIRFLFANNVIATTIAPVAQNYLAFDTLGFNVTR
jgi:hypothetical protein